MTKKAVIAKNARLSSSTSQQQPPQADPGNNGEHRENNPAFDGGGHFILTDAGADEGNSKTGDHDPQAEQQPLPPIHGYIFIFHPGFKTHKHQACQDTFDKPE
jgi:hypothetical protein